MSALAGSGRIAVVGMGAVGSSVAYMILTSGMAQELVLVDTDLRRAEGELMDLQHCLPYGKPVQLSVRPMAEVEGCDLVIITAGAKQYPGETRLDLLKRNTEIVAAIMRDGAARNGRALWLVITNPVDVMTRAARAISGLPPERVVGTGTVLDSARFRTVLAQHLGVDPRNVHGYVVGEHGDSEVLAWSRVTVGPYTLDEYAALCGRPIRGEDRARLDLGVRRAAYEIIERKGATHFAIGVSTGRIWESINRDQRTLQTVSRALKGAYGFDELCLSLPCVLSRAGASTPHEFPLDPDEHAALLRSAEVLEKAWQATGLKDAK